MATFVFYHVKALETTFTEHFNVLDFNFQMFPPRFPIKEKMKIGITMIKDLRRNILEREKLPLRAAHDTMYFKFFSTLGIVLYNFSKHD